MILFYLLYILVQIPYQFEVTAYCPCEICCGKDDGITSSEVRARANHTISVDPNIIPIGSHVLIDGIEYEAEDIGGGINGYHIDIYFDTHEEALAYGRQHKTVWLMFKPGGKYGHKADERKKGPTM